MHHHLHFTIHHTPCTICPRPYTSHAPYTMHSPYTNKVRKIRYYDVYTDLLDALKWWSSARTQHDLLGSDLPSQASCASASVTLMVCPKQVKTIVKKLRCYEIMRGLVSGLPSDYHKGAHPCSKCHMYSVPKCFSATSTRCISDVCRAAKEAAARKKKRKRDEKDAVAKYMKERNVIKLCSRCSCSIQCRTDEYKPRKNNHTGTLLLGLCYRHRYVDKSQQWMVRIPSTGECHERIS